MVALSLLDATPRSPGEGRAVLVRVGLVIAAAALLLGFAVGVAVSWLAAPIIVVLVGAGLWFGAVVPRLRSAEERVLRQVGPVREAGDSVAELRLTNLVEGLAPNAGLPKPRCLVIDDDVPNSLVVGRSPGHGCLVVTTGLLDKMSRMEVEAVVAHGVVRLRGGAPAGATTAMAFGGAGWLGGDVPPPSAADFAAVALTRYPPGLVSALRVIDAGGPAAPRGASAVVAGLWIVPPGDGTGVAARVDTLEEL